MLLSRTHLVRTFEAPKFGFKLGNYVALTRHLLWNDVCLLRLFMPSRVSNINALCTCTSRTLSCSYVLFLFYGLVQTHISLLLSFSTMQWRCWRYTLILHILLSYVFHVAGARNLYRLLSTNRVRCVCAHYWPHSILFMHTIYIVLSVAWIRFHRCRCACCSCMCAKCGDAACVRRHDGVGIYL